MLEIQNKGVAEGQEKITVIKQKELDRLMLDDLRKKMDDLINLKADKKIITQEMKDCYAIVT